MDVRLGGIYALQRIMQDSPRDQPTVVAVLCAFVRDHANAATEESASSSASSVPAHPPTDIQAALTVVGTRNTANDGSTTVIDFTNADLLGANLNGANLNGAHLRGVNLARAYMPGANFTDADLLGANLTGANLYRADFTSAQLSGANLTRADLYRADFTSAHLSGVNLTGADLYNAKGLPPGTP